MMPMLETMVAGHLEDNSLHQAGLHQLRDLVPVTWCEEWQVTLD